MSALAGSELPGTFPAAFAQTVARYPHHVALRTPDNSVRLTWRQYANRVRQIATGLAALGVRPGDTVGLMLSNRPEFHLVDTAVLHTGATPFSVYNTLAPEQIAYLFANAGNRVVVCESQFVGTVHAAAGATNSTVEQIVCVDAHVGDVVALADLAQRDAPGFDFERTWQAVRAEDVLTVIYTSGTTGPRRAWRSRTRTCARNCRPR
jgi:long-subunit acyl-CoA synthetase (AMP-forming)